jgi:hypothetical protein
MSYHQPNPTYYQTFQPDTPFHPGAEGWSTAPWMTWGDNPNLAGRRKLATDGLGKVVAISGLGADETPQWVKMGVGIFGTIGAALGAYHGYKRNNSAGWGVAWALFGSVAPFLAVPFAVAQGFGQPAERHAMARNPRRRTKTRSRRR